MRSLLTMIAILTTAPVLAGETAWQQVSPEARLRLISSDVLTADGRTSIGLEIDMPMSTNTYWRVPGETGIPTQLDFAGSTGVKGHEMAWPYPLIETKTGYVDYVYRGPTVLPVDLQLEGGKADLKVHVLMGICSDVCVPVTAEFELPLDFRNADRAQGLRLAQAEALQPIAWTGAEGAVSVGYDAAAEALAVRIDDAAIEPLSLIADRGPDGQLFGAPQKSPDGKLVLLPLLGGDDGKPPEGKTVRLTFMTGQGPFWLDRRVDGGGTVD